jgi:antitoxin ParD1/3/4/toxin ParE1/3/4
MTTRGYRLTSEARRDLDEIGDYLLDRAGSERAIKALQDFRDAFRKLADTPGLGHYREDLLDRRYKFWCVYSYVIAYRWEEDPIQVIAVVHGARDLAPYFARRLRQLPPGRST